MSSPNLQTLNSALHAQLERLNNPNLKGDDLHEELARSKAMSSIGKDIIATGKLVLDAEIAKQERLGQNQNVPGMLGHDGGE